MFLSPQRNAKAHFTPVLAGTSHAPITVHYSTSYGAERGPGLCESKELSTPPSPDPRYVACAVRMTPAPREVRRLKLERYG